MFFNKVVSILFFPVIIFGNMNDNYIKRNILINDQFPSKYNSIVNDTMYLQAIMVGSVGAIALLPADISKWDHEKLKEQSLTERWKENVGKAPIWDKDSEAVNYIGHPLSGAAYYTLARNDGLDVYESTTYSFLMSTFFWEYGYEAFAEKPSIQDLIVTPVVGSIMGEYAYSLKKDLDKNDGLIYGSKTLGDIGYFTLNPIKTMTTAMKNSFNLDTDIKLYYSTYDISQNDNIGFKFQVNF